MICGGSLQWRVIEHYYDGPVRFGPTDWEQLPHECPPGAVAKFYEAAFERGREQRDKSFFQHMESEMTTTVKVHVNGKYRATVTQDGGPPVVVEGNYAGSSNPSGERSFYLSHPAKGTFEISEEQVKNGDER